MKNRSIRRLMILTFLVQGASFSFGAVYMDALLSRGFNVAVLGILFAVATALSTVVEVLSGDWGDRYGQKRIAVVGLVLWAGGIVGIGLSNATPVLLLSLLAWMFGEAFYSGAPQSLTINQLDPSDTPLRQAAVRLPGVSRWIGAAAGGILVFLVADPWGYANLLALSGAILAICALWLILRWPEQVSSRAPGGIGLGTVLRLRRSWPHGMAPILFFLMANAGLLSVLLFVWQPAVTSITNLDARHLGLVLLLLTVFAAVGAWATKFTRASHHLDLWVASAMGVSVCAVMLWGEVMFLPCACAVELFTSYALTLASIRAHSLFSDEARNLLWSFTSACMAALMAFADVVTGSMWNLMALPVAATVGVGAVVVMAGVMAFASTFLARKDGGKTESSTGVED